MAQKRAYWDSRLAFILASIGSAIGLGNIWRFPYVCYKFGGGAFLITYIIALFSAGIPLLLLEFIIGHRTEKAAPSAMNAIKFVLTGKEGDETVAEKKGNFEWVGWFALLIGFFITTYYAVVMGWSFDYLVYSIKLSWGNATKDFFFNNVLGLTSGPFHLGSIQWPIVAGLAVSWIWIILSIWKGAKTVGKVVYVTVLLPWLLILIFVIRGITLQGALNGIRYYLTPNLKELLNVSLWHAAYSQVFFSLTVGFGVMIAYASFLPRDVDIVSSAFIIGLSDAATAYVGGFAVFSTLGHYALLQHTSVSAVMKSGPQLAFITYPTIINHLPLAPLFGVLFFLMLLTLAIDSAFSLVEAIVAGLMDKFGWNRKKTNIGVAVLAFIFGIIYTTGAGLYWLDIVDHFMNFFGLFIVGFLEATIVAYIIKPEILRIYANRQSYIKVGKWWISMIKYVVPIVAIILLFFSLKDAMLKHYGGYKSLALFLGGWLVLIIAFTVAILLSNLKTGGEQ